jgi:hypothetical protein
MKIDERTDTYFEPEFELPIRLDPPRLARWPYLSNDPKIWKLPCPIDKPTLVLSQLRCNPNVLE